MYGCVLINSSTSAGAVWASPASGEQNLAVELDGGFTLELMSGEVRVV